MVSWKTVEKQLLELSQQVEHIPDVIVGITKGGVIPARVLAKYLHINNMFCITVKKRNNERIVTSEITEELKGKQILLVEDILETGKSLLVAKKYLESKGAHVKTASMYIMAKTEIKSDYYIKEVSNLVQFPWE